jgi:hypothetical protein
MMGLDEKIFSKTAGVLKLFFGRNVPNMIHIVPWMDLYKF